jgi:Predicted O-methyltransferase
MGLRSKWQTLLWFGSRPDYWGHAMALGARKLRPNRDAQPLRSEARNWAASRAVSKDTAYVSLGLQAPSQTEWEPFAEAIDQGESLARSSLVAMGGQGAIDFLFASTLKLAAGKVVETGVAYGWSSLAFLAALDSLGIGRLVSVDMPYPKANNEPWVGVCVPERLRARWELIRQPDRNGLLNAVERFGYGNIDLVHYDSDKSYWGRRWAYPILWKALRPGGLFISDDIQDNFYFKEFSEELGLEPTVIEHLGKYVGCLRKP